MLLTLLTPPCGWKPGSPTDIIETTVQPLMRGSLVWSREDCLGAKSLPQCCAEGRECSRFCGKKKPGEAISGEGPLISRPSLNTAWCTAQEVTVTLVETGPGLVL